MSITSISPPRPVMLPDEYKKKKARSGITVSDIWCGAIRISKDQDKAYSANRTPIPEEVVVRVRDTIGLIEKAAYELFQSLQATLPDCSVTIDDNTLDIYIKFPSGKTAFVEHRGLEITGYAPVFKVDAATGFEALFLYTYEKPWERKTGGALSKRWFLWRGDFVERRNSGLLQSYRNDLTEVLLKEALKRYI